MSKVIPLVMFGMAFILGGIYWHLWDDSIAVLDSILIEDVYYDLISFIWRLIPPAIIVVGIMCLIAAGIAAQKSREEIY